MFIIKMKTIIAYIAIFAFLITVLGGCFFTYGTSSVSAENSVEVPIIMYHSVVKDKNKAGRFVITPNQFEQDLIFIKENGYEPVFMQDIINFVYKGTSLPEKPIVLTFDDGYYNNFIYVFPLLKKYKMKAVISIVGVYTDLYTQNEDVSPEYSHLSWDNVSEMMDSGLVEFQNHSYNFHTTDKGRNGSKKKLSESFDEYERILSDDLNILQTEFVEHTGYCPTVYTYPFGAISLVSTDIIKNLGFKASLSCENKTNYIKSGDKDGLYLLNRFIRPSSKSLKEILKK